MNYNFKNPLKKYSTNYTKPWQHSSSCDPNLAQSCMANHENNEIIKLNMRDGRQGLLASVKSPNMS